MKRTAAEPIELHRRIKLIPFHEIHIGTEPAYIVKGLIPRVGLVVVWGPPKCGKTFWTADLALHVALNREYRGRRVVAGPVVYVVAEGIQGFRRRIEAFRQNRMTEEAAADAVPFYAVEVNLDLVAEHHALIAAIRQDIGGVDPAVVVIDTLNRTLRGSESSDEDMAAYIAAADAVRTTFNCAVIVVHHCGIDATRPRGHTSLGGAVDAQLAVKRDTAGGFTTTVEWQKDGPEGDVLSSRLVPVEIGVDDDGDAITSCVVEPVEGAAEPAPARLSLRLQRALEVLGNLLATAGEPAPAGDHYPAGVTVASRKTWHDYLFKAGVLDPSASNPREDFSRVRRGLVKKKRIGEWDGRVWIVRQQ
ncbi:MAG: AAA family ATPase [Alphaproteobacteria bacterium]